TSSTTTLAVLDSSIGKEPAEEGQARLHAAAPALQGRERLRAAVDLATALALVRADGARRADVAGGRVRRLPPRPAARGDLMVWRPPGASRVSSRTQTSTTRCAAAGRRAQVLGSRGGVGRAATGTPGGQ